MHRQLLQIDALVQSGGWEAAARRDGEVDERSAGVRAPAPADKRERRRVSVVKLRKHSRSQMLWQGCERVFHILNCNLSAVL